jgi:ABC-type multidrug transport system fused ATPase/permease subunit
MERSLFRYILKHTWRNQVLLLIVTAISFPLIYINLELPKRIVNGAIGGRNIPQEILGFEITQVTYLMFLSGALLTLIALNGAIKYWLNVYRGIVGERMVRRLRFELNRAVLRFPLPHFKRTSAGEIIPMVTAETDPIGSFIGESISLPAFQGGLLLTYLTFIFVQDPWLGAAAVALYPPQVWLIPRLQRRINQLAKRRIQTTREYSDRIGDVIGGAAEVRANHTQRYELADTSNRLGTIYDIRVDIYKRKFFVKFLNNFLAQVTPFFFYSIGGYFVIQGKLSLGALVAVLAAYKDIIDPWKELLQWYATKEDVRIKYEQIVSQFEPPGTLPAELLEQGPEAPPRLAGPISAAALAYTEDGAAAQVDRVSFEVPQGQTVALLGVGDSGKDALALLVSRLVFPTAGKLNIGELALASAHSAITGSRIAFASRNAHIFSGTLLHNLLYGLKHRPLAPPALDGEDASNEARRVRDAEFAGNSVDSLKADWIDASGAGIEDPQAYALSVLRLIGADRELLAFGLAGRAEQNPDPAFVELVLEARARVREKVHTPDLAPLVELFDRERYHINSSVGENLVFGTAIDPRFQPLRLAENGEVRKLLLDTGLLKDVEAAGIEIARLMVELFADEPADSELFAEYSFISPEDVQDFRALLRKIDDKGQAALTERESRMLLALPFKIVVGRHRVAFPDAEMRERLVAARLEFQRRFGDRNVVEFADPQRFNPTLTIQDNILFGRPVYEQARAEARVSELVREVALEVGMEPALIRRGLDFDVGPSGARLNYSQKQRIAIARALMKNADVLVFDEPTSGLDPATERAIINGVLEWTRGKTVLWSLGRAELAQPFDRVLVFDRGKIAEDGSYAELATGGTLLPKMLA